MPDTGVSQTIVSADIARDAKLLIRPTHTELRNASGSIMYLLGEADAVLCNEKHSTTSTVLVAKHINHSVVYKQRDEQHVLFWTCRSDCCLPTKGRSQSASA